MVASLLLPGAGHLMLGQRRLGLLTMAAFAIAATTVVSGLVGSLDLRDATQADLFFCAMWTALAVWFFGIGDSGHAASGEPQGSPNPRVAFLLNFCTRGLGYFHVERPWLGALALLGWALFVARGPRLPLDEMLPLTLVVQSAFGLHAYAIATRAGDGAARRGLPVTRLVLPALIVGTACAMALQTVSAAVQAMTDRTSHAVTAQRQGQRLHLDEEGLSMTLPTAQWRFEAAQGGNSVGSLVSPRAHLLLLRAEPDALGLDGFIVQLAGGLAVDHGPVRLVDQRRFHWGGVRGRELSLEWTDNGLLEWTHLFLVPHGKALHTVVVAFPPRLDGQLREEVEGLLRSFRFSD